MGPYRQIRGIQMKVSSLDVEEGRHVESLQVAITDQNC